MSGATAMLDPDPGATAARDVRALVIGLASDALDDPAAYGGSLDRDDDEEVIATLSAVWERVLAHRAPGSKLRS